MKKVYIMAMPYRIMIFVRFLNTILPPFRLEIFGSVKHTKSNIAPRPQKKPAKVK